MERADAQIPSTKNIEGQMVSEGDPMEPSMNAKPKIKLTFDWVIAHQKLNFNSQMKIVQLNQRLEDVVNENADSQLRKFKRHIREDKYM